MPSLDTSIANAGLPTLARTFLRFLPRRPMDRPRVSPRHHHPDRQRVGRLGDLLGRRRLLLAGIVLFHGSLAALRYRTHAVVVDRRPGGAGSRRSHRMMALTVALVGETVPKGKTGRAMGLLGTMSALGTSLRPSLGGVLIAVRLADDLPRQ